MRSLNTTATSDTTITPKLRIQVKWGGNYGTRTYSSQNDDGFRADSIISFSGIRYLTKQDNISMMASVSFTLSDDDGTLFTAVNYGAIEGREVIISYVFEGAGGETIFFRGVIASPVDWDEQTRLLTVNAETQILSQQVGFSTQEGQFGVNNDVAIGKFWPICFGTPAHVPAILVEREPNSKLKYPTAMGNFNNANLWEIVRGTDGFDKLRIKEKKEIQSEIAQDSDGDLVQIPSKIYVEDGSGFDQDEIITVMVEGVLFRGVMSNNIFTVEEANVAKYTDVILAIRDVDDADLENPFVAWIEDQTQSLENTFLFFSRKKNPSLFFGTSFDGEDKTLEFTVRKCVRQNGTKIWLEEPLYKKIPQANGFENRDVLLTQEHIIDEVRGLNLSGMTVDIIKTLNRITQVLGHRNIRRDEPATNPYGTIIAQLNDAKYIKDLYWEANAGVVMRQWDEKKDIYVANALESDEVLAVYGVRTIEDKDYFVPIPKSYYTVDLSKSTSPFAQAVGAPPTVTTIEFDQPLSTYKDQKWKDEIYVTLTSSLGYNTAVQIKWIVDNYTNQDSENTSFGTVQALLDSKPSNFALLKEWDSIKLIESMAWQAGCCLRFDGEEISIIPYMIEDGASTTLDDDNTWIEGMTQSSTSTGDLVTVLIGNYKEDYRPTLDTDERSSDRQYRYVNNVNTYGYRSQDYEFFIYNHQDCVANTLNFWGYRLSNIWKTIELTSFWQGMALQVFDPCNVSYNNLYSEKTIIQSMNLKLSEGLISYELLLPYILGSNSEAPFFYQTILSDAPTNPSLRWTQLDYDLRIDEKEILVQDFIDQIKFLRGATHKIAVVTTIDENYTDTVRGDIYENGDTSEPTETNVPIRILDSKIDPLIGEKLHLIQDSRGHYYTTNGMPHRKISVQVIEEFDDYLKTKVYGKTDKDGNDIIVYVAKQWDLRKEGQDGETFTLEGVDWNFAYTGIGARTLTTSPSTTENQKITPPYFVNCILVVENLGVDSVNLTVDIDGVETPLDWEDTNKSGRQWAEQ